MGFKASEEATAKSSQLSALRSQARKLQQACDFQRRQSMEMHEAAEQERQLKAAEKAAAKAARAAKEAKRAAKRRKRKRRLHSKLRWLPDARAVGWHRSPRGRPGAHGVTDDA